MVNRPQIQVPSSGFRVPSSGGSPPETRNPEPGTNAGASGAIRFGLAGIKGVGEKTASVLLKEFHTIENMYKVLDKIKSSEIKNYKFFD